MNCHVIRGDVHASSRRVVDGDWTVVNSGTTASSVPTWPRPRGCVALQSMVVPVPMNLVNWEKVCSQTQLNN